MRPIVCWTSLNTDSRIHITIINPLLLINTSSSINNRSTKRRTSPNTAPSTPISIEPLRTHLHTKSVPIISKCIYRTVGWNHLTVGASNVVDIAPSSLHTNSHTNALTILPIPHSGRIGGTDIDT